LCPDPGQKKGSKVDYFSKLCAVAVKRMQTGSGVGSARVSSLCVMCAVFACGPVPSLSFGAGRWAPSLRVPTGHVRVTAPPRHRVCPVYVCTRKHMHMKRCHTHTLNMTTCIAYVMAVCAR